MKWKVKRVGLTGDISTRRRDSLGRKKNNKGEFAEWRRREKMK
jgi:hypothetical protein